MCGWLSIHVRQEQDSHTQVVAYMYAVIAVQVKRMLDKFTDEDEG